MADVNWTKYRCSLCLMIGLGLAAIVSGLIAWLLLGAGAGLFVAIILFLVVWASLGLLVDRMCRDRIAPSGATAVAMAHDHAATPEQTDETAVIATAPMSEEAAAAEQRKAAEDAAEREAKAKSAADAAREDAEVKAAEAERRAAEESAERERREREKAEAEAERLAAEQAEQKRADEEKARAAEIARATAAGEEDFDGDGVVEGAFEGTRPEALDGPRNGEADDLKRIKGIGPKLEQLCNKLGFYHFDQIAGWTVDEVAWVDSNLEGFKGRVTRDEWVAQAKVLSGGGETDFSKRVDDGDVPSSQ